MKKAKKLNPINIKFLKVISIALFISILFISIIIFKNFYAKPQYQTFSSSSNLNFLVDIPSGYEAKEEYTTVEFKVNSKSIVLDRNCTQFDDIRLHMESTDELNNKKFVGTQEITQINGYPTAIRILEDQYKSYSILANYCVYTFYTPSPELFSDLDQIAHSFQYTGIN